MSPAASAGDCALRSGSLPACGGNGLSHAVRWRVPWQKPRAPRLRTQFMPGKGKDWWTWSGSNRRPLPCPARALASAHKKPRAPRFLHNFEIIVEEIGGPGRDRTDDLFHALRKPWRVLIKSRALRASFITLKLLSKRLVDLVGIEPTTSSMPC